MPYIYERVTMETIHHSRVWAHPLKVLYEKLQSCCDIGFETEDPGLLSPNIFIDMAFWHGQARKHYLQAKVPNQTVVFEY